MWRLGQNKDVAPEIVHYLKCMELYGGITPSELDEQDSYTVEVHWLLHNTKKRIENDKRSRGK